MDNGKASSMLERIEKEEDTHDEAESQKVVRENFGDQNAANGVFVDN